MPETAGWAYAVECRLPSCRRRFVAAEAVSDSPAVFPGELTRRCPYCGAEDTYQSAEIMLIREASDPALFVLD